MLLNNLYIINNLLNLENNSLMAKIQLNKDNEIFKGHFPNQPVVPGVCLTNMVTDVISKAKGEEYFLKFADYLKFINVVKPTNNEYLMVNISKLEEVEFQVKAEGSIFFENIVFMKFKVVFSKYVA